jgi:uncharacterized coiled-coil protein SlyX
MSEGFDPFAPLEGAMFTGRPFRATRAARGEEEGDSPKEGGRGPGPAEMDERLAEMEAELAELRRQLVAQERSIAARLDEQMGRLVMAVADLIGERDHGRGPAPPTDRPKPPRKARIAW